MLVLINYSDNIMQICVELTDNLLKILRIKYRITNQPITAHKYLIKMYRNM